MRELDPRAAHEAMKNDPGAVYLDVRTEAEFAQGHPEGAYNVPVAFAGMMGMKPNPDFVAVVAKLFGKDAPVYVGCKAGPRSTMAVQMLAQAGFTNLTHVAGGFAGGMSANGPVPGWVASGLPTSTTPESGRTWAELKAR